MDENLDLHFHTLSLSSDLQLRFGSETTVLRVNRLVLSGDSKLSGNNKSKLIAAFPDLTQTASSQLSLENIKLEIEQCLDADSQERIILLDGGVLEIGNVQELTGTQELVGEVL